MPSNPRTPARALAFTARRPRRLHTLTPVTAGVIAALYGSVAAADDTGLQEIIVTATRHAASAQDIPASITAISGKTIEATGITDIAELARSQSGINVTDKGGFAGVNGSDLIIRGLNSDSTSGEFIQSSPIVQPVATYVDDTPLFFNLRLSDLDRVEILRGPQGTLYGSGSLGGTIRYVQNAPDTHAFDAKLNAGVSSTDHTNAVNYDVDAMLNLPLSDTFALRLNAGYANEAGFIDQTNLYALNAQGEPTAAQPGNLLSPPVTYSSNGTNSYQYTSARVAALWRPNEDFHAQLSYYYQLGSADGYPYSAPRYGVGSLTSTDYIPATNRDEINLAALTMEGDLGFATLTSTTSWANHQATAEGDVTSLYASFPFYSSLYGANPRVLVVGDQGYGDKPWAEELRLASKPGGRYEWVAGLFYKSEDTAIKEHDFYPGYLDYFNACVPLYGASNGDGVTPSQCGIGETAYTPGSPPTVIDGIPIIKDQAYIGDFQTHYTDLAMFGEFTWHVAPDWQATGGLRAFKQTVTQSQQTGLLFDGPDFIANETHGDSWRKVLGKVNVAYHIDPTTLAYATWSQGFRRGAVNALPPTELGGYVTPPGLFTVQPDTANNYELGVKGTVENRFRYSAAIFDIQWENVQQSAFLTPLALPGAVNIGKAYSRGFEAEFYGRFTEHISLQFNYTYDKTALTSYSAVALSGLTVPPPPVGSPLPGTPTNAAFIELDYGQVHAGTGVLNFAINARYQGSLIPALSATIPTVDPYTMLGLRATYTLPHWFASLYVDNLTNQIGVNSYTDPIQWGANYQALVSRPRTIGVTFGYSVK